MKKTKKQQKRKGINQIWIQLNKYAKTDRQTHNFLLVQVKAYIATSVWERHAR